MAGDRSSMTLLLPPDETPVVIGVRGSETVEELLWAALGDKQLQPNDYFIRLRRSNGLEPYVPSRHETLDQFPAYEAVEVLAKVLYQVELNRHAIDQLFGFSVEAELVENIADAHNQDELCVYVSRVEDMSLAAQQGLVKGDEIMVINGAIVSDLDMMYIESVLQEEQSLCMMLRSPRTEPPELAAAVRSTDEYIESLVCPPPPSDGIISDEQLGRLIVPSPWEQRHHHHHQPPPARPSSAVGGNLVSGAPLGTSVSGEQIAETLLKSAEQVTSEYCRLPASATVAQQQIASATTAATAIVHHQQPSAAHHQQQHYNTHHQVPIQQHHHHQQQHTTQLQIHPAPPTGVTQAIVNVHHHPQPQPQLMHQQSLDDDGTGFAKRPPLSDAEKLRKVIRELVDTEKTYVEVSRSTNPKLLLPHILSYK